MSVEGFGGRLGDARRARGQRLRRDYKPAELARDIGVTSATISRWENDEVLPDLLTVVRLAKLLEITPGWLAFGENNNTDGGVKPMPPARPVTELPPVRQQQPKKRRA